MPTAQKLGVLVVGLAMLTTISLPDRKFDRVAEAFFRGVSNLLGTAMGTRRGNL